MCLSVANALRLDIVGIDVLRYFDDVDWFLKANPHLAFGGDPRICQEYVREAERVACVGQEGSLPVTAEP